jgi:hypothetical protein
MPGVLLNTFKIERMVYSRLIIALLILAGSLGSCSKNSGSSTPETPKSKYFFKVTVDGNTLELNYDSTVCQNDPVHCDSSELRLGFLDSYAFMNGYSTNNRISLYNDNMNGELVVAGLSVDAFQDPRDDERVLDLFLYANYTLGPHPSGIAGYVGPYRVEMSSPDFTDNTNLELTFNKIGPVGSKVESTFIGEVYMYITDTDARRVPISGSFAALRTN